MKIKKIQLFLVVMTIFTLFIAGCSTSSSNDAQESNDKEKANKTVTLKLAAYVAPTTSLYRLVVDPWMKKAEELSGGKLKFEVYPGEQLGKAGDMLQITRDGVADIGVFNTNLFMDNMPLTSALSGLPDLSKTSFQGTKAYNELLKDNSDLLETDYLKNGIRPIMGHVSPTYEIWTTGKEIRVPEDIKGLKIRTPGGLANKVYEYMGVVPVTVAQPEVYEALDKGVVHALSSSSIAIDSSGINEIVKYAIFPQIGTVIHGLVINEKVWQGLPKDIQEALMQAGEEMVEPTSVAYDEYSVEINDEYIKGGGIIADLTQAEKDKWKITTDKFTEAWLKENKSENLPIEEVLKSYKDLLVKYKEK